MPRNLFQEIVFTLIMVVVMVYAMVCYNVALDMGGMRNEIFVIAFSELPMMGGIAFVLELFVVGPLAKRLAFRIVDPRRHAPIFITLAISALTVCFMCPLMSLAATLIIKQPGGEWFAVWIQTSALNFPMALCWQLFYAGPLVRLIFRAIFVYPRRKKELPAPADAHAQPAEEHAPTDSERADEAAATVAASEERDERADKG